MAVKANRDRVDNICKIGQGKACCRYLLGGSAGLECGKLDYPEIKAELDRRVANDSMVAQGDNCEGVHGVVL